MDAQKLITNLEKLKKQIPKKPQIKTNDFPRSIGESLTLYLRQRTISILRVACWQSDQKNWPLPLYVDPNNIKIGYLNELMFQKIGVKSLRYYDIFANLKYNKIGPHEIKPGFSAWIAWLLSHNKRKKLKYYDWLIVPVLCNFFQVKNTDDFYVQLFEKNYTYFKTKLLDNPILKDKKNILEEIFDNYSRDKFASCICTLYPLVDFIIRQYFNTKRLDKDITAVNGLFKAAGFNIEKIDNLKPGAPTTRLFELLKEKKITWEELQQLSVQYEYELGFPGIALSSFLHFSLKYYEFFRSENISTNYLNRHAIIHGSINLYGTKINTIKLFTYLYLMLELEPVLKIVFKET